MGTPGRWAGGENACWGPRGRRPPPRRCDGFTMGLAPALPSVLSDVPHRALHSENRVDCKQTRSELRTVVHRLGVVSGTFSLHREADYSLYRKTSDSNDSHHLSNYPNFFCTSFSL